MHCPRCGELMKPARAYSGAPSRYWLHCTNPACKTYVNTFQPLPHQAAFLKDPHRFTGNFGGYGSGKTATTLQEVYKHVFITPNGNGVIGANVTSQYEQTIKRDLESDCPAAFIRGVSNMKNYIDFINGYRLMFRPYDDVDKLRSYNLDLFVILEASEVKHEAYTQLKTRLRNSAAFPTPARSLASAPSTQSQPPEAAAASRNWLKGIVESNPDAGWIRRDLLAHASEIHKWGEVNDDFSHLKAYASAEDEAAGLEEHKDPMVSAHVTSTSANIYLPPDFIQQNKAGKPKWWVQRFLYGSFLFAEGLVYPGAAKCIVPDYDIPKSWPRLVSFDYGLSDPAVFICAALDAVRRKVVIYKEVRCHNKDIEELAKLFFQATADIPSGGLYTAPLIDPKSGPKRDYLKKSLSDYFLDYGIVFQPGQIDVSGRIFRMNTWIEHDAVEIFESCRSLNLELSEYKFRKDESANSGYAPKPEDKNNHSINAMEWILCALPADPKDLTRIGYSQTGQPLDAPKPKPIEQYDPFSEDTAPTQLQKGDLNTWRSYL